MKAVEHILYFIVDWDKHYENNRSREIVNPAWFPCPNDQREGFLELLSHKRGENHYAFWINSLALASKNKCPRTGELLKKSGVPHDLKSLAFHTRISLKTVTESVPRLIDLGWLGAREWRHLPAGSDEKIPHLPTVPFHARAASEREIELEQESESSERTSVKATQLVTASVVADAARSLAMDRHENAETETEAESTPLHRDDISRIGLKMKQFVEHCTRTPWKAPDWSISKRAAQACNGRIAEAMDYLNQQALARRPPRESHPVEIRTYGFVVTMLRGHFAKENT